MKLTIALLDDEGRFLVGSDVLIANELVIQYADPLNDERQDQMGRVLVSRVKQMLEAVTRRERRKAGATDRGHARGSHRNGTGS